jgi:hypothetical protein
MTLYCDTRDDANSVNTVMAYDFHGFNSAVRKIRRNGAAQAAGGKSHLGDNSMKAAAVTTERPIRRKNFVFIFIRFLGKRRTKGASWSTEFRKSNPFRGKSNDYFSRPFRNSEGVCPVFFLNKVLKEDFELKPDWYITSRTVSLGSLDSVKMRFASLMR